MERAATVAYLMALADRQTSELGKESYRRTARRIAHGAHTSAD